MVAMGENGGRGGRGARKKGEGEGEPGAGQSVSLSLKAISIHKQIFQLVHVPRPTRFEEVSRLYL